MAAKPCLCALCKREALGYACGAVPGYPSGLLRSEAWLPMEENEKRLNIVERERVRWSSSFSGLPSIAGVSSFIVLSRKDAVLATAMLLGLPLMPGSRRLRKT